MNRVKSAVSSAGFVLFMALPITAQAGPLEDSCAVRDVIGNNDGQGVAAMIDAVSQRWSDDAREKATKQLTTLVSGGSFAGGNVYRLTRLGDEMEHHLVTLRLKQGEISGVSLRYEWTPDGLSIVALDIKRRVTDLIPNKAIGEIEPLECP